MLYDHSSRQVIPVALDTALTRRLEHYQASDPQRRSRDELIATALQQWLDRQDDAQALEPLPEPPGLFP